MSITGNPDNTPGGGPIRTGVAVIDLFTGVYASTAILAALLARENSGEGQYIDMALLDVSTAMLANQSLAFLNTGNTPVRQGNTHPSIAPYQVFHTSDGNMLLAVGNDGQFERFCTVAGPPEWALNPEFSTNKERVHNRELLASIINEVTKTKTTTEWIELLEDKVVPCGPVNQLSEVFADPQVQFRSLRVEMPPTHTADGKTTAPIYTVASPLRLSATPPVMALPPPSLGEHTQEVLATLGLSTEEITHSSRPKKSCNNFSKRLCLRHFYSVEPLDYLCTVFLQAHKSLCAFSHSRCWIPVPSSLCCIMLAAMRRIKHRRRKTLPYQVTTP